MFFITVSGSPDFKFGLLHKCNWASQVALVAKNLPVNAGDIREVGPILGSGRYLGGEHGNALLYSCLENPMNKGAWWDTVPRVAQNRMTEATLHTCMPMIDLTCSSGGRPWWREVKKV